MQEKIPKIETRKRLLIGDNKKRRSFFWKIFKRTDMRAHKILAMAVCLSVVVILSVFVCGIIAKERGDNFFDKIAQSMLSSGIFGEDLLSVPETHKPESGSETQRESERVTEQESEPATESEIETSPPESDTNEKNKEEPVVPPSLESLYSFDYSSVPKGEYPIVPMDLSLYSSGTTYINNSTGYKPDVEALLRADLSSDTKVENLSSKKEPLVLVIHTHATEAFSPDGAVSYSDGGEIARSRDRSENVVSLGKIMVQTLEENGIPTLHCTVMHDSVQYRESYSRAEETIKEYIEKYPSIKLVIDLHRDAVIKSNYEMVRPVTLVDGEECAQVMCVVGSDWAGDKCENWRDNLALALKLRESLNSKYTNLCRPTDLRPSTYNQELSRYSLLLEIGAAGNSLDEAKRAATLVADALAEIIIKSEIF